jgi:hypothetical protein
VGLLGDTPVEQVKLIAVWSKRGAAVLYPLHDVARAFSRAFQVCGFDVAYTRGFNPQPKIELSPPLGLGVEGWNEILLLWLDVPQERSATFWERISVQQRETLSLLNDNLPEGLRIEYLRASERGDDKKRTIGASFKAALWRYVFATEELYARAKSILAEHSDDFTLKKADADTREIHLVEIFSGASKKTQSFYKILKDRLSGVQDHFKAERLECYGEIEIGEYVRLQDTL